MKPMKMRQHGLFWQTWGWRQWGVFVLFTPKRVTAAFGPVMCGYGYFPADGFWRIHRWFNVRLLNVLGFGVCVSVNWHQVTLTLGLGILAVKLDFGTLHSIPEWCNAARSLDWRIS